MFVIEPKTNFGFICKAIKIIVYIYQKNNGLFNSKEISRRIKSFKLILNQYRLSQQGILCSRIYYNVLVTLYAALYLYFLLYKVKITYFLLSVRVAAGPPLSVSAVVVGFILTQESKLFSFPWSGNKTSAALNSATKYAVNRIEIRSITGLEKKIKTQSAALNSANLQYELKH